MNLIFQLQRQLIQNEVEEGDVNPIDFSSDSKTTSTNYVFIMIFLILALGYLIILILTIYRGKKVFTKPMTTLVSKVFYFLGFILSAFRVISSVLLIIESYQVDYTQKNTNNQQQDDLAKLLYNGMYVSDVVFGMMYFSMFWFIILYSYKSHIRVGNVLEDTKNPAASNKGLNVYTFILAIYSLLHLVFICMYNLGDSLLDSQFYLSCICVNNVICIVYFIIGILILKCKFSGAPFKSNTLEKEMKHIEKMGYFWLFGRCFETTLDILIIVNSQQIQELIIGKQESSGLFWNVISYFILPANYIISEVIPLLYCLLQESVKIFSKNPYSSNESQKLIDENDENMGDEYNKYKSSLGGNTKEEEERKNSDMISSYNSEVQDQNIIKLNKDNKIIKQIEKKERRKGFGYIQKVLYQNKKKLRKNEQNNDQNKTNFRLSGISQKSGQGDDYDGYTELAFRVLPINTLSSWILQEINQDIYNMKRLHLKNISKVSNIAIDNEQVCLISRYYENGSLYDMLPKNTSNVGSSRSSQVSLPQNGQDIRNGVDSKDNRNSQNPNNQLLKRFNINSMGDNQKDFKFTLETKMRIAIQISKTMAKLHKIGIIHGHLSSSNVLFDKKLDVKIADIGLTSLKKLISIRFGYSNKTHFTAPEHLQENSLIVKNPTTKSDIYSFAFILWELFMEREAFGKLSLEDLKKTIINDNSRPKIPDNGTIPKEVATIIRYCWLANPNERPEFGVILANLKRINNESPDDDEEFVFDEQEYKLSFKDKDQLKQEYKKGLSLETDEEDEDEVDETKFRQQNQTSKNQN